MIRADYLLLKEAWALAGQAVGRLNAIREQQGETAKAVVAARDNLLLALAEMAKALDKKDVSQ